MLDHWNKELKRQGSRSVRSNKGIREQIKKVAQQEVDVITSADKNKVTQSQRQSLAKSIDDLYETFPIPMFSTLHDEYEKEVKKGINSFIVSQKK
jgi:hypothetical protein